MLASAFPSLHGVGTDKSLFLTCDMYFLVGWSSQLQNLQRVSEIQVLLNVGQLQRSLALLCWDLLSGAQGTIETTELSFICSIDFSEQKKKCNTSPSSPFQDVWFNCSVDSEGCLCCPWWVPGVAEAKWPHCKPLFIKEQSGNFATITAQIWGRFAGNKTITL